MSASLRQRDISLPFYPGHGTQSPRVILHGVLPWSHLPETEVGSILDCLQPARAVTRLWRPAGTFRGAGQTPGPIRRQKQFGSDSVTYNRCKLVPELNTEKRRAPL
jgi:hypothetical protein